MPRRTLLLALVVLPGLLAGCAGSGSTGGGSVSGDTLKIYSSQPLHGRPGGQAEAIVRGERMALADAGGRVGKWRVEYIPLDDSDPKTGTWDPGLVSANARKAAQDSKTIAYLGEMDTGASAVAIPILNETGILEVSPTDSVVGFTSSKGANPGEPDKYYPTRDRNFVRLVPSDAVQSLALLSLMQDERATRLYVMQDEKLYGRDLARLLGRAARSKGVTVVKAQGGDPEKLDLAKLSADVAASGADSFLYAGQWSPRVAQMFTAVAQAAPKLKLFGPSSLVDDAFAAQLGAAGPRVVLTAPWLALGAYPPSAREVARRYQARYGAPMPPQALYGYESMSAVLASIRRAGKKGNNRGKVINQMLATRNRRSVIGTYSVDKDGNTSLKTYGSWRVRGGRLVFLRVLDPLGA